METIYTWEVTQLYTLQEPTQPDYVVNALYLVTGVQGEYTANCQGSSQFAVLQDEPDFIPYEDLTNEIVIGWVQEQLGTDGISNTYANIDGQINSMITPPVSPVNTPLPWTP